MRRCEWGECWSRAKEVSRGAESYFERVRKDFWRPGNWNCNFHDPVLDVWMGLMRGGGVSEAEDIGVTFRSSGAQNQVEDGSYAAGVNIRIIFTLWTSRNIERIPEKIVKGKDLKDMTPFPNLPSSHWSGNSGTKTKAPQIVLAVYSPAFIRKGNSPDKE